MKRAPKSAVKLAILQNSDPIFAETEAVQNRIRQRAFEISQTRPPDAHALYDWKMAESEIMSVPSVEITERDGKFEVKFAVAGLNPDDVNVMVAPQQILLKSEYRHHHDTQAGTVHLCDFRSALIFRSVDLPEPIDVNTVKAELGDGVILVNASRGAQTEKAPAEQARPQRTTPVRKQAAKKAQTKTRATDV
jgi:HSP20 family molecular chaperone IbpA